MLTIYAMVGAMGSGKTSFALQLSKNKDAKFLSLDKTIRDFNQPIRTIQDYEQHMQEALRLIGLSAIHALTNNQPIVLDFGGGIGHWPWLKSIADQTGAKIEIYHFDIPLEVRRERVQKRNQDKPEGVYFFTMSDEEVMNSKTQRELPEPSEQVRIIRVTD